MDSLAKVNRPLEALVLQNIESRSIRHFMKQK